MRPHIPALGYVCDDDAGSPGDAWLEPEDKGGYLAGGQEVWRRLEAIPRLDHRAPPIVRGHERKSARSLGTGVGVRRPTLMASWLTPDAQRSPWRSGTVAGNGGVSPFPCRQGGCRSTEILRLRHPEDLAEFEGCLFYSAGQSPQGGVRPSHTCPKCRHGRGLKPCTHGPRH